jgi:type VI secretion system protein VasD
MKSRIAPLSILLVLALFLLATCGGAPPKKSTLSIRVTAASDVNPDLQSRPSPVILHLLELSAVDAFNRASFFELTGNAAAALGGNMLSQTEIVLTPGSSKESVLDLNPQAAFLGFVVAYRDIDNARWRLSQPVIPGKTENIVVDIGREYVTVTEVSD